MLEVYANYVIKDLNGIDNCDKKINKPIGECMCGR